MKLEEEILINLNGLWMKSMGVGAVQHFSTYEKSLSAIETNDIMQYLSA